MQFDSPGKYALGFQTQTYSRGRNFKIHNNSNEYCTGACTPHHGICDFRPLGSKKLPEIAHFNSASQNSYHGNYDLSDPDRRTAIFLKLKGNSSGSSNPENCFKRNGMQIITRILDYPDKRICLYSRVYL